MKIYSRKALEDAQKLAAVALDPFDWYCATLLLKIAYGHYEINPESESSMHLVEAYYNAD